MKTPYLKFHKEKLISNYQDFHSICKKYFQNNFQICYSVKTNSNKEVIETLEKINSGFEIASIKELKLTPKDSFKVMNGPAKTEKELKEAIKTKTILQIDSFSEIEKISKLKIKPEEAIIRLSTNNSKFGFSSDQIKEAIIQLNKLKIKLAGFHIHQSTLNKFSEFEKNLKEQSKIIKPFLKEIKYLNLGGGFPDNYQLKNLNIKLENYMKEIYETLKDFKGTFIFEPGRNLVSDAYTLITKAISIKEKNNIDYAILDIGINFLSKITLANFKFNKIIQESNEVNSNGNSKKQERIFDSPKPKTYTLAGPLLFNNDIIGKYFGTLEEGDLFEVENVGAYCIPLSWDIIYDKVKTYN